VGSEISINNISKYLKNEKNDTSYNTISRYIEFLCEGYIIYEAKRYDVKGKVLLKTLSKYYVVDTGLRNFLLTGKDIDTGHLLENIIYLELLRRNYKVTVGKVDRNEVDFIAENNDGIKYFQVSATILNETTRERELKPLNMIKDYFPKYLITLDKYNTNTTFNGIKVINALDFLLGKE
jgi:predicted AAA+ superfamily ATPase